MKGELVSIISTIAVMKCPLCEERFRLRVTLRWHLKQFHCQDEAEKYLKRKKIKYR